METHGYRTTHGVGLLSIMDVGFTTTSWVGRGFQDMSGLLLGLVGEVVVDITAGLL